MCRDKNLNIYEKFETQKQKKVLIVDDDKICLFVLSNLFEEKNYKVIIASDGQEAVDLFDDSFDLVITDYQMPRMNGIEAAAKMREKEKSFSPAKKPIPIIGFTACGAENLLTEAQAAGMNTMLLKPLTEASLEEIILTHTDFYKKKGLESNVDFNPPRGN